VPKSIKESGHDMLIHIKCDLVMCYQILTGSVNVFFSHVPTLILLEATL